MIKKWLSMFIIIIALASMFTGCGSGRATSTQASAPAHNVVQQQSEVKGTSNGAANYTLDTNAATGSTADGSAKTLEAPKAEFGSAANDVIAVTGTGAADQSSFANAILAQRKVIRNANVTVEVDDFEIAYGKIKSMVNAFGFVQESNISKEKIYVDSKEKLLTKGIIIVRVDKDKFEDVLAGIKGLGLLLDESIKSDDVTDKFFDTESRLRLLKYEESRLEEYLNKISDPDTIFKTESRLTDIRHEIESLTGTLKKWTDLVELSTVTINMSEKGPVSSIPVRQTYFGRLSENFSGSFKGVISFCGELLIFIVSAFPVLIVLGLFGLLMLAVYRKFFRKHIKKNFIEKKEDNIQM